MKIKIDRIKSAAHNLKPGLVDARAEINGLELPMTLSCQRSDIGEGFEIENGSVELYYYPVGKNDFLVYEEEEQYLKENGSETAFEQIVPVRESAYCLICGKVGEVKEENGSIEIDLECRGTRFTASVEIIPDKKIEKGNIIRAVWWTELVI